MVDQARRWIYREQDSRDTRIRKTEFARRQSSRRERAAEKGMGMADMCEKHGAFGGVGVDVVRYYVGA